MEEVNNTKIVKTPEAEYFFMVNPDATNMDAEKAYVFHTTISKALFLCKGQDQIFNWQCHYYALESKDQMKTNGKFY